MDVSNCRNCTVFLLEKSKNDHNLTLCGESEFTFCGSGSGLRPKNSIYGCLFIDAFVDDKINADNEESSQSKLQCNDVYQKCCILRIRNQLLTKTFANWVKIGIMTIVSI